MTEPKPDTEDGKISMQDAAAIAAVAAILIVGGLVPLLFGTASDPARPSADDDPTTGSGTEAGPAVTAGSDGIRCETVTVAAETAALSTQVQVRADVGADCGEDRAEDRDREEDEQDRDRGEDECETARTVETAQKAIERAVQDARDRTRVQENVDGTDETVARGGDAGSSARLG